MQETFQQSSAKISVYVLENVLLKVHSIHCYENKSCYNVH